MEQEITVSVGENVLEQPEIVRAITESTLDAIILMDDKGNTLFWNPAAERIFGYNSSEVMGKNLHKLLAPAKYHTEHHSGFNEFLESGKGKAIGKTIELFALRKGGEEFPIELSLSGFQVNGRWHAAGIVRDVTEKKHAEQALKDSQQRFEAFMNNSSVVAWMKDEQGRHVYLSKIYENRFNVSLNEWLGKTDFELWPQEIAQTFWKNDQAVLASGQPMETIEETIDSDGNRAFWLNLKFPFQDSTGGRYVGGIGMDITERMRIQAEREETAREMSALLKGMISGFAVMESIFDDQGVFVDYSLQYVNDACERLTGLKRENIIGKSILEVWPGTDHVWIENCGRVATTGQSTTFEIYHDPSKKYWRCSVYRPSESSDRFCIVFDDITEVTTARHEHAELERKALLAEKLDSLNMMAGGIAHDFNNQLAVVIGFLDLAMDSESLDSQTKTYLIKAMAASQRSAKLSEQMLIYSGSNLHIPEPLNLKELLVENRERLLTAVCGHISLDIDIKKRLPLINGNPDHIVRLVTNLIVNACEAMGDAEGQIKLRTGNTVCDEAELSHSYVSEKPSPGRFVLLEVSDTGSGMDIETQRKMFDPFFTTKFIGRGLGMPEVIGIVRAHHGALFVESQIGKGTTIRVLFPVAGKELAQTCLSF